MKVNEGTTHWEGCFADGPEHWICAMRKIGELEGKLRGDILIIEHLTSYLSAATLAGYDGGLFSDDETEH